MTFDEGFVWTFFVREKVHPAHKKQILTHLKLTGCRLGYLLNFGEELMKYGITRGIHGNLDPE